MLTKLGLKAMINKKIVQEEVSVPHIVNIALSEGVWETSMILPEI